MTTHRRQFLRLCGIAGIATLAGCGGSSGGDGTPVSTDTPSETTEAPSETAESPTETTESPTETTAAGDGWPQQAKLTADDGDFGDLFGHSVAVSADGTTAVVGALGSGDIDGAVSETETPSDGDMSTVEDVNGQSAGAAYVFDGSGESWTQQAKLIPDDGDRHDNFGISVAVSSDGTTAVIGAHADEDPNGEEAGSAYVFEADDDSWTQQAKLIADDGTKFDAFGYSVAMSGDGTTAVVGSFQTDPDTRETGSAYVFDGSGESWTQQAKLTADDGDTEDCFGISVAVSESGTTVLVGEPYEGGPNGDAVGTTYVFDGSDGSWNRQSKLTADDGDTDDWFGYSVAVSSDGATALVGAFGDEDPNGDTAGSAYIFEADDDSWTQQAKLTADDGNTDDWFGRSVAISGDGVIALIGAENVWDRNNGNRVRGSAYVFDGSAESWTQQTKLTGDAETGQKFGNSVATSDDGTTALVGDMKDLDTDPLAGSAHVFTS